MTALRYAGLPDDLSTAAQADLVEVYTSLNNECADIKAQITEAKSKVWTEGTYSDPEWYKRVHDALRLKQRVVRLLQAEFKRRKDDRAQGSTPGLFSVNALDLETLTASSFEEHLNTSPGFLMQCVATPTHLLVVWRLDKSSNEEGT